MNLTISLKHRENKWSLRSDDIPGLYLAHADLELVLADFVMAWKKMNELCPGQCISFPQPTA